MTPREELTAAGYEVSEQTTERGDGTTRAFLPGGATYLPGENVLVASGFGRQFFVPESDPDAVLAEAKNHAKLSAKLEQAQSYFTDTYANWPTMTAGQKDTANRNAQRALANLIRHVRSDLSSEGA